MGTRCSPAVSKSLLTERGKTCSDREKTCSEREKTCNRRTGVVAHIDGILRLDDVRTVRPGSSYCCCTVRAEDTRGFYRLVSYSSRCSSTLLQKETVALTGRVSSFHTFHSPRGGRSPHCGAGRGQHRCCREHTVESMWREHKSGGAPRSGSGVFWGKRPFGKRGLPALTVAVLARRTKRRESH